MSPGDSEIGTKRKCPPSDSMENATVSSSQKQSPLDSNFSKRQNDHTTENKNQQHFNGGDETDDETSDNDNNKSDTEMLTLETFQPREPSYAKANAIPFHNLCERLENLWKQRKPSKSKKVSNAQKLEYLLPDKLLHYLDGGSPYPMLRLILPDHDSGRPHTGLKEAKVGVVWAEALGLTKNHGTYQKLLNFTSPAHNGPGVVGDISLVIREVMEERYPCRPSKITVGEVNDWLDVLVAIVKDRFGMSNASVNNESGLWKSMLEREVGYGNMSGEVASVGQRKVTKQKKYSTLVAKLIERKLSSLEHKWIVRIILQKIEIGIGFRSIFGYIDPYAQELYDSFNNLKELCKRLSDPVYKKLFRLTKEQSTREMLDFNRGLYLPQSTTHPEIQQTISPMLSLRTSPETFLTRIAQRHKKFAEALPAGSQAKTNLALQHPAFACEIKMDGERMLVHIKRGIVTMQTRNNTWYSPLYSPALGPSLRAAISRYDVDVVFDGEIIGFDSYENRPAPFGTNRSIAKIHRTRRRIDGTLDERDINLHANQTEINVMTIAKSELLTGDGRITSEHDFSDDQYWLKYVIFDVLYVDGPDAKKLLSKSIHLFPKSEVIKPGSIINYDLMRRKSVLYNLVEPQPNTVELIESVVVRSDGSSMDSGDYFLNRCALEYGKTPCELDSINLALNQEHATPMMNSKRHGGKKHEEIEIKRAFALEQCYRNIVESAGQEGLLLKDLASPYYLGSKSRSIGYWWKLKPDYFGSSEVSDVDVLVLGGYFASGMRKAGFLSSLLVGCADNGKWFDKPVKYITLTRVNFTRNLYDVMKLTGFQKSSDYGSLELGKWFEADPNDGLPDFISPLSYQLGNQNVESGWKPNKKDFPDLWIRPEDSFVLTLNAGEIVQSGSFAAGVTLRFPRIQSIRAEGLDGGAKPPDEITALSELHTIFEEKRDRETKEISFGLGMNTFTSRFLTEDQLKKNQELLGPKKNRKVTKEVKGSFIPIVNDSRSYALDGLVFTVLEGNYSLENDSFAVAEAIEKGWATEARKVRCREDVIMFIKQHGGRCQLSGNTESDLILGGNLSDARVSNYRAMINNTCDRDTLKKNNPAQRLIEIGGVAKWTFVYSIVHKFLKKIEEDKGSYQGSRGALTYGTLSICSYWPSLRYPRRSDYLLMSPAVEKSLLYSEDSFGLLVNESVTSNDFQRALEEVRYQTLTTQSTNKDNLHNRKVSSHSNLPWQESALNFFKTEERWVFGGQLQTLWPYHKDPCKSTESLVILYPDIFSNFGSEEIENSKQSPNDRAGDIIASRAMGQISSVLPLVKIMGAVVASHLHSGVTHVLCELKKHKILEWVITLPRSVYADDSSGMLLHKRLMSLEEMAPNDKKSILLVTPEWVREMWCQH